MRSQLFELGPEGQSTTPKSTPSKEAALKGPLGRVMLLLSYDGTSFSGFAAQEGSEVETVGGRLAGVLSKMVGRPVALTCAGRTDAGVHATGQVVHADLPAGILDRWLAREVGEEGELLRLAASLTSQCGPTVAVTRARLAPEGFDARRSALSRRYRYELLRSTAPEPLARLTSWHLPGELDLSAMRIASDALLGEHDFAAFCRRPPGLEGPIIRRIGDVTWEDELRRARLSFEIEANAFCHRMVRSLVGALVAVGRGEMTAADLLELLLSADRSRSPQPAPPAGLCLLRVRYPEELVPGGVLLPPA